MRGLQREMTNEAINATESSWWVGIPLNMLIIGDHHHIWMENATCVTSGWFRSHVIPTIST